ncbi:hypothetical protein P171DRAFT_517351 [Karstenula rhodostoma CBS 690.94]|uniref:Uncharacterized protein n=1 Tax=Karstenula rhodostoma CBS 690.94 TaxID=1392251 RepID=A0A9P4PVS0_9PLEO|nr:hypothetical protein P171DRAFT_517351 [Karstenula rhodostoma CBS 690.94]
MPPKRKASEQPSVGDGTNIKKPRVTAKGAISSLVPVGERKMAKRGVVEPEMLRMLCEDRDKNNERKELHFKKIIHADIDWNNKDHIDKINAWRNQIYGRAGIKNKTVLMWHKDEEAWLELFWQLLIVEAGKHGIESPLPKIIRAEFNEFFNGKVLHSASGEELEPRGDRGSGPFSSKLGRLVKALKPYLDEKLRGMNGNTFVPKINREMLEEYQKLKSDLAELGCNDQKIIPWEEVEDEANDKDYVVRCRKYIASLPDQDDAEMEDEDEEDTTLVGSEQLDKELLELATEQEGIKVERTDTDKLATIREPSWVTVATGSASSSREASPFSITEDKSSAVKDIASLRKNRADSVASTNATVEENSNELTLVGEEVAVDKAKDRVASGYKETEIYAKDNSAAENEAAAALLTLCGTQRP